MQANPRVANPRVGSGGGSAGPGGGFGGPGGGFLVSSTSSGFALALSLWKNVREHKKRQVFVVILCI